MLESWRDSSGIPLTQRNLQGDQEEAVSGNCGLDGFKSSATELNVGGSGGQRLETRGQRVEVSSKFNVQGPEFKVPRTKVQSNRGGKEFLSRRGQSSKTVRKPERSSEGHAV